VFKGIISAAGVSVSAPLPSGLTFVRSSGGYDAATAIWTIGTVPGGGHAMLTITAQAGDVLAGDQTVTATVHSTTSDSNPANNSASVTEQSVPAPVTLTMVPDPDNPPTVDIGLPGTIGWTASLAATDNPTASTPQAIFQWSCTTASGNPCPAADGTDLVNQPSLTYEIQDLGIDTYTVTLMADVADPNYQSGPYQTSITFSTTNSGG